MGAEMKRLIIALIIAILSVTFSFAGEYPESPPLCPREYEDGLKP